MDIKTLTEEIGRVSSVYTSKFGITPDADWYLLKLQEEMGELIQSYLKMRGQAKTDGKPPEELETDFRRELADVFSHVLLVARYHHIDIEREVEDKWLVWTRGKSDDRLT